MGNLKSKMQEFNEELVSEMEANQKLNQQCKDYVEKLNTISAQFESYRLKQESRTDILNDKLDSLKNTLREEKDMVSKYNKRESQLREN